MGTAGGIHHFRDEILKNSPDAFFVLNGDIASSFPLQEMLATHKKSQGVATLMTVRMDKLKLQKYGCVVVDEETCRVKHFVEKPESFVSDLISCGIYLFNKEVFGYISTAADTRRALDLENGIDISQFEHKAKLAASNAAQFKQLDKVQLENDLMPLLASSKVMYAHVMSYEDFWMPIKTGSSTIAANRLYLQHFLISNPQKLSLPRPGSRAGSRAGSAVTPTFYPIRSAASPDAIVTPVGERTHPEVIAPAYIHPTAVIHPSSKIGPNAFIGPRVLIGRGVRVRDAIVLDGVEIKNQSCVIHAVVGWESKIGFWTRIEGSGIHEEDLATQKGFKVPSAAILGKGVVVGDELIVRDCIVLPHKELKQSFNREILM
jgi:mannose-1-phosphate guanylyltransferase